MVLIVAFISLLIISGCGEEKSDTSSESEKLNETQQVESNSNENSNENESSDSNNNDNEASNDNSSNNNETKVQFTPREKTQSIAKDIVDERFKEIKILDYAENPKKKMIQVHFMGADNFTKGFIRKGMYMDCADIFKKLYSTDIPIYEITCFVYLPLQDKYGNSSEEVVMKMNLNENTAQKINWDNILITEFFKIADGYWEHPVLRD